MNVEEKKEKLQAIYDQYEREAAEFKKAAACALGCADWRTSNHSPPGIGNNHADDKKDAAT